jgi:hypothetical protein
MLYHVYMSEELECLEDFEGGCNGPVALREPLTDTFIPYPRCEAHWAIRLIQQEYLNRKYPLHAPSDFDPADCGEYWGEDY